MNPNMRITAHENRVGQETESIFCHKLIDIYAWKKNYIIAI